MMTKRTLTMMAGAIAVGITVWAQTNGASQPSREPATPTGRGAGPSIAAAGRVEPVGEERSIGTEVVGRIARVLVDEGDRVAEGTVLAELDAADVRARLASAEARLAAAEADYVRLVNGARAEERREADAERELADVAFRQASLEDARRARLFTQGAIAQEEAERAARDAHAAHARLQAATARAQFVSADARDDDRARAQAAIALGRAAVAEAHAQLAKTTIRSPLSGVVLRRHRLAGELVAPDDGPLFVVADTSRLRIRAEVDETDVARIATGQRASVRADAYGDREFTGVVGRVGAVLGRKRVYTDRPTEKLDTAVLETLIDLSPGAELPIGLRVDVFIDVAP